MIRPPGYLQVLRECPGFRLLFGGRVVSLLGDWFSMMAAIAMLREVAGSSATALSGMLILKLLPIFLAGPVAGVVADRLSRRGIMVVSDLVRAVLGLALLATPWMANPLYYAYTLILLQVVASAFFEPARSAALPQLVPDRYLSAANALGAMMWSVMFALGAALGGIVTDRFGWRWALVIDAATFLVSAWLVGRIRLPARPPRPRGPLDLWTVTGLRDFGLGLRFIAGRPDIATALSIKTGWSLAGAVTLFLTLFGERVYPIRGRPDLGVAVLYVARAVGTGIGPLLARRFVTDESPGTLRRLIAISFLWPAVAYFGFSLVDGIGAAALMVALAHFGGSVLWVYSSVVLQRMTPDAFRGRVMSADIGLATLVISCSIGVYGALASAPGADLRVLVRWLAISLLVPTVGWLIAAARWPVGGEPER